MTYVRSCLPARVLRTGYTHEGDCAVHEAAECTCQVAIRG